MSKKNKLHQVKEKKSNTNSFTIKGGYLSLKIENIHEHLQEVNRGSGVKKSKKAYDRKKSGRGFNDCSLISA